MHDVIKTATPQVQQVTSGNTIVQQNVKSVLSEVHKLIHPYLTIPIVTATSERTFPLLRHLLIYFCLAMTERRLVQLIDGLIDCLEEGSVLALILSGRADRAKREGVAQIFGSMGGEDG